jgi:hypothetical protein
MGQRLHRPSRHARIVNGRTTWLLSATKCNARRLTFRYISLIATSPNDRRSDGRAVPQRIHLIGLFDRRFTTRRVEHVGCAQTRGLVVPPDITWIEDASRTASGIRIPTNPDPITRGPR